MPDPTGAASPTLQSMLNAVRHAVRDGVPTQDTVPVPFAIVQLEDLSDQVPAVATPTQTVFMARMDDVPTQRYMNAKVVPATLVAYVDGSVVPVQPVADVDQNGNFSLPVAPVQRLQVTYAWQYFSDGEMYQFIDQARQWLREFSSVTMVPDGLVPALGSCASYLALRALARSATLAQVHAGDSDVDWSSLAKSYSGLASSSMTTATAERKGYYDMGPEALDPTVAGFGWVGVDPYTPER